MALPMMIYIAEGYDQRNKWRPFIINLHNGVDNCSLPIRNFGLLEVSLEQIEGAIKILKDRYFSCKIEPYEGQYLLHSTHVSVHKGDDEMQRKPLIVLRNHLVHDTSEVETQLYLKKKELAGV